MPPTIQTIGAGVNYIIGYMPHPIQQRRSSRAVTTEAGRDVSEPARAVTTEAGRDVAEPATLTSHPRSSTHPSAAPTAAPYQATPTYGAAGFSAKGTA